MYVFWGSVDGNAFIPVILKLDMYHFFKTDFVVIQFFLPVCPGSGTFLYKNFSGAVLIP
jgi:hypothetical protein